MVAATSSSAAVVCCCQYTFANEAASVIPAVGQLVGLGGEVAVVDAVGAGLAGRAGRHPVRVDPVEVRVAAVGEEEQRLDAEQERGEGRAPLPRRRAGRWRRSAATRRERRSDRAFA